MTTECTGNTEYTSLNLRGVLKVMLGNDHINTSLEWCCTSISVYHSHYTYDDINWSSIQQILCYCCWWGLWFSVLLESDGTGWKQNGPFSSTRKFLLKSNKNHGHPYSVPSLWLVLVKIDLLICQIKGAHCRCTFNLSQVLPHHV